MRKRIVVVGSTNVDMVITGKRIPTPGETVSGAQASIPFRAEMPSA